MLPFTATTSYGLSMSQAGSAFELLFTLMTTLAPTLTSDSFAFMRESYSSFMRFLALASLAIAPRFHASLWLDVLGCLSFD